MVQAILLKEDRYFYFHPGINPAATARAIVATYLKDDRQGASTLTMQLARRVYNINSRQVAGKLQQMLAALWLELRYSKHDILEAYLNLAPMGGNIEGVGAASRIYFHKDAGELSLSEALSLAVMPQSPARRARFGADFQDARDRLALLWQQSYRDDPRNSGLLTLTAIGHDRTELPFWRRTSAAACCGIIVTPKFTAPWTSACRPCWNGALGCISKASAIWGSRMPPQSWWTAAIRASSLDRLGRLLRYRYPRPGGRRQRPPLAGLNPETISVWPGHRSGLIHPQSILKDAPTAFGSFQPENFDHRFTGPISAHDALVKSRNLPAVWLAGQVNQPNLYGFLRQAGIKGLRGESHYGLSLALGGGELTMAELARLYLMLASQGHDYPLRDQQSQPISPQGKSLLSPAAAFMVRDILKDNPRADGLPGSNWTVAWKTGTSWGYRDAWSAGITGPYVLVVWVGNFDATPNPAFVGVRTAGPLFFALSDALQGALPGTADMANTPPDTVKKVAFCAASGELPNPWCPKLVDGWYIPGVSPIKVSNLHRPVWLDNKTGAASARPTTRQFTTRRCLPSGHQTWRPCSSRQVYPAGGRRSFRPPAAKESRLATLPRLSAPP